MEPRPVINLEEFIGKTVGRRLPPKNATALQKTFNQILTSQRRGICPKGVYRFNSHEEADQWMWTMMNRKKVN